MKYTVENTTTQEKTVHWHWSHAVRAALKAGRSSKVVIVEHDKDEWRIYNAAGQYLGEKS